MYSKPIRKSVACSALAVLAVSAGLLSSGTTLAGDVDYRLRSYDGGYFRGSHALLTSPASGYVETSYCGRTYWVRGLTYVWSEKEVKNGRLLLLESQGRSGRRVLCWHPNEQAKLDAAKFGPSIEQETLLRAQEVGGSGSFRDRMRSISKTFGD